MAVFVGDYDHNEHNIAPIAKVRILASRSLYANNFCWQIGDLGLATVIQGHDREDPYVNNLCPDKLTDLEVAYMYIFASFKMWQYRKKGKWHYATPVCLPFSWLMIVTGASLTLYRSNSQMNGTT